jgi:hypothetical protein
VSEEEGEGWLRARSGKKEKGRRDTYATPFCPLSDFSPNQNDGDEKKAQGAARTSRAQKNLLLACRLGSHCGTRNSKKASERRQKAHARK